MIDLEDKDLSILDREVELLENFGERHLADAFRIIATRSATTADHELIYDAICIATALYMKRLKDGEVHVNRTIN